MKISEVANYSLVKIGVSVAMFLTLDVVAMITHAPFGPVSPYFAASIYFAIQAVVMVFGMYVDNFEAWFSPETIASASKVLSPIKIVTVIAIISFSSLKGVPFLMIGFLFFFIAWLLATGVTGVIFHWVTPISRTVIANLRAGRTSRSEDALLKDLAQYLYKSDLS